MSDVRDYRVRVPSTIAQGGRFLAPGEIVRMEPHVARQEFFGRLETLDGQLVQPWRPPTDLERLVDSLPTRPAHERLDLLQRHRADLLLSELFSQAAFDQALADAQAGVARDQRAAAGTPTAPPASDAVSTATPVPREKGSRGDGH